MASPEGLGRQSGSTSNNTTSLVAAPQLAFRTEQNQAYRFKFMVGYSAAIANTGIGLALDGPVGAMARYVGVIYQTPTTLLAGVASTWNQILQGTASSGATLVWASIEGTVFCPLGVSGPVTLQFKSETAGSNVTIHDGSYVEYDPLPII